jgi:hypothetical protein
MQLLLRSLTDAKFCIFQYKLYSSQQKRELENSKFSKIMLQNAKYYAVFYYRKTYALICN